MSNASQVPDHACLCQELNLLRRQGLLRIRELSLDALARASALARVGPVEDTSMAVEWLVRTAVERLGGDALNEAAEYTFGLAQGSRDWPAADRRRRAADIYGVSVERFRKHHEKLILDQTAEQVRRLCVGSTASSATETGSGESKHSESTVPTRAHRKLPVTAGSCTAVLTLHVHPVDLLRNVDIVVASSNTYLAMAEPYKASVSACLRRAGARRSATGEIEQDLVAEELQQWKADHGTSGRSVAAATVAATSSGAMTGQGVRRVYHAAVAVPRPGTNDYDVDPVDVTRAVDRVFEVARRESDGFDPPLRSVCFPLLGSGRGGLDPTVSLTWMWTAIEAALAQGQDWEVHLAVRRSSRAEVVTEVLAGLGVLARGQERRQSPGCSGEGEVRT